MIRKIYDIEFITPCFCAGANSAEAEIRAASVRGQLRWWFRVLGGTAVEEATVFGSAAAEEGRSSAIIISIQNFQKASPWSPPDLDPNKAENYVWHFAASFTSWLPP